MKLKSYKMLGIALGIVLGFGAPVGSILVKMLTSHPPSTHWLSHEIGHHRFYYAYMAVTTPIFFALFGFGLGYVLDKMFLHKVSLETLNTQLKQQSITDDLTGLYNHRHILVELDKEIERASRYRHPMCGMMIDIDDFKKINDKYGHLVGDTVLKQVASILEESLRKIDIVGRYGGDEFLIILPEAELDNAQVVAQRIKTSLQSNEFKVKDKILPMTMSFGLACFKSQSKVDKIAFIEKVDAALLEAKRLGKNRICLR